MAGRAWPPVEDHREDADDRQEQPRAAVAEHRRLRPLRSSSNTDSPRALNASTTARQSNAGRNMRSSLAATKGVALA